MHDQKKFPFPSCQNLEADPNLGKCHIGDLNPYTSWKLHEKISAYFRENKIRNFFFKIPLFLTVIGIFHFRKSSSPRNSVLAIYAPNISEIHWSAEVLWRFEIFGFTDHAQARWRRIVTVDVPWQKKGEKLPILTYPTRICWGRPHWNFTMKVFGVRKLDSLDHCVPCLRDPIFSRFGRIPTCDRRKDGRTDGQTDTEPQHIPR